MLNREGTYSQNAVTGEVTITLDARKPDVKVEVVENGQTRKADEGDHDEAWEAAIPQLCLKGKISLEKPAR